MNGEQLSQEFDIPKSESEMKSIVKCSVVNAEPSLTPELFEMMTNGAESIIIVTFASGTVPERLVPVIKLRVDSGVPIFLISNNLADEHGIGRLKYLPQVNVAEAGAIALKNVNVNGLEEVFQAIQDETVSGKKGQELANAISQRFGMTTQ